MSTLVSSPFYCFLATQNGNLGSEKFGRLGKTVFDRAYRHIGLHHFTSCFDWSLFVCPRGHRLALYRIGNFGSWALVSQLLRYLLFSTPFLLYYFILSLLPVFVDPASGRVCNGCPDTSPGWILIELLGRGWLGLGCGDDHIPIIDCMKIFCREGQKERRQEEIMPFGITAQSAITAFWAPKLDNKQLLNLRYL